MKKGKRKVWAIGLIGLVGVLCFAVGCKGENKDDITILPTQLEVPSDVQLNANEMLTWNAVENATGYIVEVGGETIETEENQIDLFEIVDEYHRYSIRVQAISKEGSFVESGWSDYVDYELTRPTFVYTAINSLECAVGLPVNKYGNPDKTYRKKLTGKIVIPQKSDNGKTVVAIKEEGFACCEKITGIIIPDSIKEIREQAFVSCSAMTRINKMSGVQSVGSDAFAATSLSSIEFGDALTSIGEEVFVNCTKLKKIEIPENVTSLGKQLFRGCDSLKSVVVAVGNSMYRSEGNCIILKGTEELVEASMATGIPNGVRIIGSNAFAGNAHTFDKLVVPSNVKLVRAYAFYGCKITSIEFLEGVESIGEESKEDEYQRVIENPSNVSIPSTVTYIAPGLVSRCNLTELKISEWNNVYKSEGNCIIRKDNNEVISGCINYTMPEDTTRIGDYAFYRTNRLDEIVITDRVQSIGKYAFYRVGLIVGDLDYVVKTLKIPDSVTEIGQSAFAESRVTIVEVSQNITEITDCTFDACSYLTEVKLPSNLQKIAKQAFYGCSKLNLSIPESVREIGEFAFAYSGELSSSSIVLPDTVSTIGQCAFYGDGVTVYTSATIDSIDSRLGWAKKISATYVGWADTSCSIYYGCDLQNENGALYVHQFSYTYDVAENGGVINSTLCNSIKSTAPYRAGYTFVGWSIEENISVEAFERKCADSMVDTSTVSGTVERNVSYFSKIDRDNGFGRDMVYYTIWQQNLTK